MGESHRHGSRGPKSARTFALREFRRREAARAESARGRHRCRQDDDDRERINRCGEGGVVVFPLRLLQEEADRDRNHRKDARREDRGQAEAERHQQEGAESLLFGCGLSAGSGRRFGFGESSRNRGQRGNGRHGHSSRPVRRHALRVITRLVAALHIQRCGRLRELRLDEKDGRAFEGLRLGLEVGVEGLLRRRLNCVSWCFARSRMRAPPQRACRSAAMTCSSIRC